MLNTAHRQQLIFAAILAAVLLIAAGARVYRISSESAWFDEVASLQHLGAPGLVTFLKLERASDPPMTPLYFTLEYAWSRIAGPSLLSIRALSILFGCLCIALTAAWAHECGGPWAGAITGIVSALSLPHIYYSQEVRPYALVLLLAICSSYACLRGLRTSNPRWWAANILANVLIMWTHLFGSFLLLAQGIFLLVHAVRNKRVRLLFTWAALHLPSFALWGLWFATIDYAALDHASPWKAGVVHGPHLLINEFIEFTGGRFFWLRETALAPGIGMGLLFAAIFLAAIIGLGVRALRGGEKTAYAFWLTWLIVPPVALFAFSALLYPSHMNRYVLYSMLPLHLILGCSVASIRRTPLRAVIAAALIALLAANAALTPKPWRLDWKSVSRCIASEIKPGDALIVWGDVHRVSLAYSMGLPKERIIAADGLAGVTAAARESAAPGRTLWIAGRADVFAPSASESLDAMLGHAGMEYEKTEFGNAQPHLAVYRIPPAHPAISAGK